MPEYINREALMRFPIRLNHYDKEHGNEHFVLGIESVLEYAESLPTADVAEVVRCKDCKHWLKDVAGCTDFVGRCEWANYMVGAAGFCVYGEKIDGKGEGE
jgi:hypothetical protein